MLIYTRYLYTGFQLLLLLLLAQSKQHKSTYILALNFEFIIQLHTYFYTRICLVYKYITVSVSRFI